MESNISRDHIALEAMKTIIEKSTTTKQTLWNKIIFYLGIGTIKNKTNLPDGEQTAKLAYQYADAMIAEREKDNGGRQKEA